MEAVKQIFGAVAAFVGVLSGLVTLYAKYMDMRKKAGREADDAAEPPAVPVPTPRRGRRVEYDEPPEVLLADEPVSAARARQLVKGPAIALMVAGGLSLVYNLGLAGFGYVDEFVTPLTSDTRARHDAEAARAADPKSAPAYSAETTKADQDRTSTVCAVIALFSFSFGSAAAIWAGYNMLRLRSYWLSMAGSIAVMPGACACCFAGVPIGIWSLTVLLRPDVKDAFC
jgi:hypothetical protein